MAYAITTALSSETNELSRDLKAAVNNSLFSFGRTQARRRIVEKYILGRGCHPHILGTILHTYLDEWSDKHDFIHGLVIEYRKEFEECDLSEEELMAFIGYTFFNDNFSAVHNLVEKINKIDSMYGSDFTDIFFKHKNISEETKAALIEAMPERFLSKDVIDIFLF